MNECSLVITCATCKITCNAYNDDKGYLKYTYISKFQPLRQFMYKYQSLWHLDQIPVFTSMKYSTPPWPSWQLVWHLWNIWIEIKSYITYKIHLSSWYEWNKLNSLGLKKCSSLKGGRGQLFWLWNMWEGGIHQSQVLKNLWKIITPLCVNVCIS